MSLRLESIFIATTATVVEFLAHTISFIVVPFENVFVATANFEWSIAKINVKLADGHGRRFGSGQAG